MAAVSNTQDNLQSAKNNGKKNNVPQRLENRQEYESKSQSQMLPSSSTNTSFNDQHPHQNKLAIASTSLQQNYKKKRGRDLTFSLDCFIKKPVKAVKPKNDTKEVYKGNLLDSDNPERSSGKHRETPKKKIYSKLKQDILKHESEGFLNDSKVIYADNLITTDLNQAVSKFLKKIVIFQENAFKKDQEKAKIKRRYVLGLHQTKKYFLTKKIRLLIIASDMTVYSNDDVLYRDILNLTQLAKENEIPYVFALKRSNIGNLTKTYRPVSCVGVLNYQSAEAELQNILSNLVRITDEKIETDENDSVYEELLLKLKDAIYDCDKSA